MKASDRAILIGLLLLGLVAAFWFVILSPKREEAAKLGDQASALRDQVAQHEALLAQGEQAHAGYDRNYAELIRLGKAVPAGDDSAGLLAQLTAISHRSDLEFRGLVLQQGSGEAPTPPPPPDEAEPSGSEAEAPPEPEPAPATETAAANLPIGATVGPAGLPVMPYELTFRGGFFEIADFMAGANRMVDLRVDGHRNLAGAEGFPVTSGRLLTIDGFSLSADQKSGFPMLEGKLAVSTYVTPSDEGLTAGATPTAPAPTTPTPSSAPAEAPPTATATPPAP